MGNALHEQRIAVQSLAESRDINFLQSIQTDCNTPNLLSKGYRKSCLRSKAADS